MVINLNPHPTTMHTILHWLGAFVIFGLGVYTVTTCDPAHQAADLRSMDIDLQCPARPDTYTLHLHGDTLVRTACSIAERHGYSLTGYSCTQWGAVTLTFTKTHQKKNEKMPNNPRGALLEMAPPI